MRLFFEAFEYIKSLIKLPLKHHENVTGIVLTIRISHYVVSMMRILFLSLLLGSSFLLSACNDDKDSSATTTPSKPQPSCKIHCAP